MIRIITTRKLAALQAEAARVPGLQLAAAQAEEALQRAVAQAQEARREAGRARAEAGCAAHAQRTARGPEVSWRADKALLVLRCQIQSLRASGDPALADGGVRALEAPRPWLEWLLAEGPLEPGPAARAARDRAGAGTSGVTS